MGHPRIGLAGWYGYGNVGDDLLLGLLMERLRPAAVFSTRAGEWRDVRIHDVADLGSWSERIDLLVIGGGGLLNERWLRKLPLSSFEGAYGLLSVGIPHRRWLEGLEPLLSRARFVTVRDHVALHDIRDAYPGVEAWWLPDPAFMLPRLVRSREDRLLLNPRAIASPWLREDDPDDAVERVVETFAGLAEALEHRGPVLAVGFEEADRELLARLPYEHRIVVEREAVELIATSAALVTSRLHGAIIAATQGTPVVLVDYQDKMRGVAQMLGAPLLSFAELGDLAKSVDKLLDDAAAPPDVTRPAAYGALTARVLNFLTR